MAEATVAKRAKSPNFPSLSLKEAVEKVTQLYNSEGKSRIDPVSAVKALGYTSLNGASLRVLGSLRQYELVEDVQEDVKVSDLAIRILHGDQQERLASVREAARKPRIFNELFQEYGTDLPSDESLKAKLLTKMNFSSPEAANLCIAAFRDTIDVAKLLDNDYINAQAKEQEQAQKNQQEQKAKNHRQFGDFLDSMIATPRSITSESKKPFVRAWSLTGNVMAKLEITDIPSVEDQEFLKVCLERALKELSNEKAGLTTAMVEEKLGLSVVYKQPTQGDTELSKHLWPKVKNKIEKPVVIYLAYITNPTQDSWTYICDGKNKAIGLDGFSWGYLGEGPEGLKWLLGQLEFNEPSSYPPPNKEGCWSLGSDGSVNQVL